MNRNTPMSISKENMYSFSSLSSQKTKLWTLFLRHFRNLNVSNKKSACISKERTKNSPNLLKIVSLCGDWTIKQSFLRLRFYGCKFFFLTPCWNSTSPESNFSLEFSQCSSDCRKNTKSDSLCTSWQLQTFFSFKL